MKILGDSYGRLLLVTPVFVIIIAGAAALAAMPAAKASSSPAIGIAIPLYTYPTDGTWTQVIQAKQAYPNVPFIAIVNPNSGPGGSLDPNYAQGIKNLQSAGVTVLGYVYTSYGSRSLSSAETDVSTYKSWYGVNGILFDEMNNQPGYETYYSTLNSYVHSLGLPKTMGNPGTSFPTSYIGTMDTLCDYESNGYPSLSFVTYAGYSPSNFYVIAYSVSLSTPFLTSLAPLASWVYLTDAGGSNPYNTLPSYFTAEVAALSAIDAATSSSSTTTSTTSSGTSTLTVSSVTLSGAPLPGLWTTWNQGSTVLATGYTPTTFTGTTGGTYTVTVADYGSDVFCHWQDGSTNSARSVTLAANTALTAYYSTTGTCSASTTLTVNSAGTGGISPTGVSATVSSGNTVVASGPTPLAVSVTVGTTYSVKVTAPSGWTFAHWQDGTTNPTISVSPSQPTTLAAYFTQTPLTVPVTVVTDTVSGTQITGVKIVVTCNGLVVASGYSTLTFTATVGLQYTITLYNHKHYTFSYWDNGSISPVRTIAPTAPTTLVAYYIRT